MGYRTDWFRTFSFVFFSDQLEEAQDPRVEGRGEGFSPRNGDILYGLGQAPPHPRFQPVEG